jgi:putative flippase GtrA
VVFGVGLALTSGSLALLHTLAPGATRLVEVLLLLVANAVATLVRFLLLRGWVFRARATTDLPSAGPLGLPSAVPELESSR